MDDDKKLEAIKAIDEFKDKNNLNDKGLTDIIGIGESNIRRWRVKGQTIPKWLPRFIWMASKMTKRQLKKLSEL